VGLAAGLITAVSACAAQTGSEDVVPESPGGDSGQGRLAFRPRQQGEKTGKPGLITLQGSADAPPAPGYVPNTAGRDRMRLLIFLHGAGGTAEDALDRLRAFADDERLLLLAPKSVHTTWDVIRGGFGPDVENIDSLLEAVSASYRVDGYSLAGFSDGASYALSLGIANGDVFDSVLAFSPGFQAAQVRNGDPRFFVSHGTQDRVLPIERCSRRLVPALEGAGYEVTYEEFNGGHAVPEPIKRSAIDWLSST